MDYQAGTGEFGPGRDNNDFSKNATRQTPAGNCYGVYVRTQVDDWQMTE